jgi:hypothetical protein
MKKHLRITGLALLACVAALAAAQSVRIELRAKLRNGLEEYQATYKKRDQRGRPTAKIEFEVERGVPGASYTFNIEGWEPVVVTTDSFGDGELEIPFRGMNIPTVAVGQVLTVSDANGTALAQGAFVSRR